MKALVFGSTGQDGIYMSELCKDKGIEPIGVSRSGNGIRINIAAYDDVDRLIRERKPDYIFHFAANSTTRHEALFENHEVISTGTLNILEAVRRHHPASRVFITGSGVQFRNTSGPISEGDEFDASSPYAIARIQSVYAARYFRSLGLKVYVGYLFHHESPYRKPGHISQTIVRFARQTASGGSDVLPLGDITVEKEWTFAGDVANAIMLLVNQEKVFEAAIGSGTTHSIRDWLDACFGIIGKDWEDRVKVSDTFVPEYKKLVSNPATIQSLGWNPRVSFQQLCQLMMDEARAR